MSDVESVERRLVELRDRTQRQELGQFFTPEALAQYLADAVMEVDPSTVLDPAVGGGRLLASLPPTVTRFGLDVDHFAVDMASGVLPEAEIAVGDFLDRDAWPLSEETFDAIVANPPYVRHQRLTHAQKAKRFVLGRDAGVDISSLADYYVYFFFEAVRRLADGGRMAFVTPAQFLDAGYGRALKSHLQSNGTIDRIVMFGNNRGVFGDARTAAAVTVFTKTRSRRHVVFREAEFNGRVEYLDKRSVAPSLLVADQQWSRHFPSRAPSEVAAKTVRLDQILRIRRGLATGANEFFCLSESERKRHGIPKRFVVPILARGRNLPEVFTDECWRRRRDQGERVWLLWLRGKSISDGRLRAYLDVGEERGVQNRSKSNMYKSQPWWVVEDLDPPDYFCTYMSKGSLRFVKNESNVRVLTSLLCGWLQPGVDPAWAKRVLCSPEASRAITEAADHRGDGLHKIEPGRLRAVEIPIVSS